MSKKPVYRAPLDLVLPDYHRKNFRLLATENWWRLLPYGHWMEAKGSRIIFDREYHPICRVYTDAKVEFLDPQSWISDTTLPRYYYDEVNSPYLKVSTLGRVLKIAQEIKMQDEFCRRVIETSDGHNQLRVWRKTFGCGST